jgi:hypothetical protein
MTRISWSSDFVRESKHFFIFCEYLWLFFQKARLNCVILFVQLERMLLEQLLKFTEETHEERKDVESALSKISDMATAVNEVPCGFSFANNTHAVAIDPENETDQQLKCTCSIK